MSPRVVKSKDRCDSSDKRDKYNVSYLHTTVTKRTCKWTRVKLLRCANSKFCLISKYIRAQASVRVVLMRELQQRRI